METRLKTAEDFTIPKAYTLQKAEYVKELDSFALVLKPVSYTHLTLPTKLEV